MFSDKKINPSLFISSTVEDLKPYRQAAREAALRAGFFPVMQEYFAASGVRPPLEECLNKVAACDLLVVIAAHRYGWIPNNQPQGKRKSITWLECEHAKSKNKQVIAFIVDPQHDWPESQTEEFRLVQAFRQGKLTPELTENVEHAVEGLQDFKDWLNQTGVRGLFTTVENLETKVLQSLNEWQEERGSDIPTIALESDTQSYLRWLHDECAYIDIRGLQVGTGKAHQFGIEELYIPLTTSREFTQPKPHKDTRDLAQHSQRIELHQVLTDKYVTIIGDPGAGKTTFLRRIVFALCQSLLKINPNAARERLGLTQNFFPLFIRFAELSEYIRRCRELKETGKPVLDNDPSWLIHFLVQKSVSNNCSLTHDFLLGKLNSGEERWKGIKNLC